MEFRIFDVSSHGNSLWESGPQSVRVTDGLFSYALVHITPFHQNLFTDNSELWLAIRYDGIELTPRTQLCPASILLTPSRLNGTVSRMSRPDSPMGSTMRGGGRYTGKTAGFGLAGDGTRGNVPISVAVGGINSSMILDGNVIMQDIGNNQVTEAKIKDGAVTSNKILNGTILDGDISPSANISPSKIAGSVATLGSNQTFTGENNFEDDVNFGNDISILPLADGAIEFGYSPAYPHSLSINKTYSNAGTGSYAIYCKVTNSVDENIYGIYSKTKIENASNGNAYGIYGIAEDADNYNYAGYFNGDVIVTGTVGKAGSFTKIDHPLDPVNKYLLRASVESSEMMNICNGNIITDETGYATVILPD